MIAKYWHSNACQRMCFSVYYLITFDFEHAKKNIKGGFPLGEIFRPNRNLLLSWSRKLSDGTKQKSFEFEQ
jgi:hypothetical protein